MSNFGYVRIRVADSIEKGGILDVRSLVTHPMEGIDRDPSGKVIAREYHFVTKVTALYNGKEVASIKPTQSVSVNPFFAFGLRVVEPGTLKIIFEDSHGKRYEGTKDIKVI